MLNFFACGLLRPPSDTSVSVSAMKRVGALVGELLETVKVEPYRLTVD